MRDLDRTVGQLVAIRRHARRMRRQQIPAGGNGGDEAVDQMAARDCVATPP
ncbi:MAG TPA: hypothetical protein VHT04_06555 [Stellaceae bacterium]|nr:hypothetical protein [Stellaceae bacterium]